MKNIRMLSLIVRIASLLLMASSATIRQCVNNEPAVTFASEVPLLDCDGMPYIEARTGDGGTWKLGIDTGNENPVFDSKVAKEAGLKSTKTSPSGWPAGMFLTAVQVLKVGDAALNDDQLVAMNFSDDIGKGTMPHVGGTLAYTVFKDRFLQQDFETRAEDFGPDCRGGRLWKNLRQVFVNYVRQEGTADCGHEGI
jgi:hypothetical protein